MSETASTKPDIVTAINEYNINIDAAYKEFVSKLSNVRYNFTKFYNTQDGINYINSNKDTNDKTNFKKVAEFNTTAAVERVTEKPTPQVFETHQKMIETCMSLIREEVSELESAVKEHDLVETRDALADILYVVYGMAFRMGIDADADFELVHASNMSKFCTSEEEAQKTVCNYESLYAEGKSPYPSPAYRFEQATGKWVVYEQSTGKILKNINYKVVDLTN